MQKQILFGIAAGCAAAVVFLSATTGPMLARVLLYLATPLPLFLAGLAHGWRSAAVGALAGSLGTGLGVGPAVGAVFAASVGVPVTILCYLVLLRRDATAPGPDVDASGTEWYPIGRVVFWAAIISGVMSLAALFLLGPDMETLKATVRKIVDDVLKAQLEVMNGGKPMGEDDLSRVAEVALYVLPAATALSWMLTVLLNLWLAGRIALATGGLARPWPDIAAMRFPRFAPLALAGASFATLLPGYPALGAAAVAGSLYAAYVLLGLAVVHYITRGQPWRPIALAALYVMLIVLNTGVSLVVAIVGLADGFVPIRRGGPPPSLPQGPPATRPPGG